MLTLQDYLRMHVLDLKIILLFKEMNYKIHHKAEMISVGFVYVCVRVCVCVCVKPMKFNTA